MMKNKPIKNVSRETFLRKFGFLVLSAVLAFSLVSCGSVSYTDEDVMEALSTLIPLSEELNEIYFGEGLPISDNREDVEKFYAMFESDVESVNYHPVAKDCKYQSEADIKAATEAVYSKQYCEYLYELAFRGISAVFNEGTEQQVTVTKSYAKYIQNGDVLTVRLDVIYEAMDLGREYDIANATIVSRKKSYVTVSVPSVKNGQSADVLLKLVLTDDGLRLDTPTY